MTSLSLAERLHKPPEWLPADLAQPDVIGPYRLRKTIGQGAFAKVKLAIHEKTSTQVSVKIMSKGKIKESYVWKHLYREGQIHGMMDHPNIIKLLHVFENEGGYYMVTELASGGEVLDYIVAHRHLNEKETRKLVRQLASGVEYMNRMGVVHRDLKAENLLLDANLNLQIIDFGLSNAIEGTAQFLETQCGSPSYSAPELLAGEVYTQDVDVWSMWVPPALES
jgi:serine/threonine protein kinase